MNDNKNLKVIIGVLIFTLIVLATCFELYYRKQIDSNLVQNNNIVQTNIPSGVALATMNTAVEVAPVVANTVSSTGPFLDLLSPKGGENFCKGDNLNISWKGSKEFNTVDIWLVRGPMGNPTNYSLGSFPSSYNEAGAINGEGSFSWKAGYTKAGIELPLDESYKIILNGCYPYQGRDTGCLMILNKAPQSFNILDCRG